MKTGSLLLMATQVEGAARDDVVNVPPPIIRPTHSGSELLFEVCLEFWDRTPDEVHRPLAFPFSLERSTDSTAEVAE